MTLPTTSLSAIHVFFFRGLSTSGKEHAQWAFFDFGPMHRHLEREFGKREIVFHPVIGMGSGTFPQMAARARTFLEQHPIWQDPNLPVHFLGHSAGGLIARLILESDTIPREKVLSLMTVASPHRGAHLARICIDLPERHRRSYLAMRAFGYDMAKHRDFFKIFLPDQLQKVITKPAEQLRAGRVSSIVCAAPRSEWCRPMKTFYRLRAFKEWNDYTDGMIEHDTQAFGEVVAELKIDHFRQIGLFGEPHRFQQMCDVLRDFFVATQRQA